jgi:Mrp family chromosome partitioning ATPase
VIPKVIAEVREKPASTDTAAVWNAQDLSVRQGIALLDQAQRDNAALQGRVRRLAPENLRGFNLLSRNAPEKYLQEFRQLRSRLQHARFQRDAHGLKTRGILVTSPRAGEGKTFVAMNLALMIAVDPAARILLVDLNVRRPSLQSRFKLPEGPGLEEILAGSDCEESVWWMPDTQLYVATLSAAPRDLMDPLRYDKLSARMDQLGTMFDWIILDGPPLLESPDAEIASLLADATLMVVRKDKTSFAEMDECVNRLAPGRLAGVVYNSFSR